MVKARPGIGLPTSIRLFNASFPNAAAAGLNPDGTLSPKSPNRRAATDAKDIGVDFDDILRAYSGQPPPELGAEHPPPDVQPSLGCRHLTTGANEIAIQHQESSESVTSCHEVPVDVILFRRVNVEPVHFDHDYLRSIRIKIN